MQPLLKMSGISKRFGATHALREVDLALHAGEVLALVGENGAGKSTLMKIISGALTPDEGRIALEGRPYRPRDPQVARRAGVAMIYQELSLAPHLTVAENIMLGMEPTRRGLLQLGTIRAAASEALAQLGHPEIAPDKRVSDLTIAEQQLVEIARALAIGCKILVLDEPTSTLTQKDIAGLFELIEHLKAQGHGIVYISHFIEEVKKISDRFVVLRDGRLAGGGATAEATIDQIVEMMIGRHIEELYPERKRQPGEDVLDVRELAGMHKPQLAGLQLRRGEVLGIAGLVGAGRTELLRAIFGLDPIRQGRIRIGAVTGPFSPERSLAAGAGLLSENRAQEGLALSMTIADNITLSKQRGLGPLGFVLPRRQAAASQRWITHLGIRCQHPNQLISELSGGNQQKVAIARLLHHDVDVLLLDEPTRGIDVASKAQIYELINDVVTPHSAYGEKPKAVLMVSSYLPELLGVCDRIAVMCRGRLGEARPAGDWTEHSLMLAATGI